MFGDVVWATFFPFRRRFLEAWEAQNLGYFKGKVTCRLGRLGYFIQNFPGDLETGWQRKGRRAKVACGSFESRHCQSHLEPAFSQGIEIFWLTEDDQSIYVFYLSIAQLIHCSRTPTTSKFPLFLEICSDVAKGITDSDQSVIWSQLLASNHADQ